MADTSPASPRGELFEALARESTLTERVAEEIKQFIVTGHLHPGDRLPPERELAHQFGVSRTVVREAVRALAAQGLLLVRAGSGSVVRSPTAGDVAESIALYLRMGRIDADHRKILEVRCVLEIEIAGLAAQRRTAGDLARMEAILAEAAGAGDTCEGWLDNDRAFHAMLARAAKNELFSVLLDSLAEILVTVRRSAYHVAHAPGRALKLHGMILEQVRQGDPEGARRAMREHLREAEETIAVALTRPS